ncbi:MAG: enoyl-CoA hydratase/isomerase family protein [Armatimonadetes bacterium]|nr:enoyl-CoA hydratase/isomerase family protein [Armatimonadota bacterium]
MATAPPSYQHIQAERRDGALWITLNRPPLNILTIAMLDELNGAVAGAAAPDVRALVFAATGKAFSAGADVKEHAPGVVRAMLASFHRFFRTLARTAAPTVAVVQGPALGGGCELAIFCDLVIVAQSATFGQPEIKVGAFPPIAAVCFPHLMGLKPALELVLLGETVSAERARELGLVTRVVPDQALAGEAAAVVGQLGKLSAPVLRLAKRAVYGAWVEGFDRTLVEAERLYLDDLMATEDAGEGVQAFLERRAPRWRHR